MEHIFYGSQGTTKMSKEPRSIIIGKIKVSVIKLKMSVWKKLNRNVGRSMADVRLGER